VQLPEPTELILNTEPATGKSFPPLPVASARDVREAVSAARQAQPAWAALGFRKREQILLRFQKELVKAQDEVADVLVRETGKPRYEAFTTEIFTVADLTGFYARRAETLLADEPIPLHLFVHKKSLLRYSPRGVIGVISPWNFPFSIPVGDVVMALAAGNAVVLKPSEFTPLIALKARELFDRAGLPGDVFRVVVGKGATGTSLVETADMVVFTGSVPTGRKIARACGERLIPCILELGGKDAAVVLSDADLDRAARTISWGAFANSGQICASVERVYVQRDVAPAFQEKVVGLAKSLRQGDPANGMVDLGAMVTEAQLQKVTAQVEQAKTAGAKVLTGGAPLEGPGRYYPPTIVTDVRPDMDLMREETFGPILPITVVENDAEAVKMANDSPYGLSAYVFGRKAHAERVADQLMAGTVMVNEVVYTHGMPETPWGGVKTSGLGHVHGLRGLKDLSIQRHIHSETLRLPAFWLFPYTDAWLRRIKGILNWLF
jgi:succinate-semialdehyde dehydrogenase/glutarate-semialdehyde dehydrogenase